MRKYFCTAILTACLAFSAHAGDLYDVNYDPPSHMSDSFNESVISFQNIYLQYESNIKNSEEKIRADEKSLHQEEIRSLLAQEQDKYAAALVQARDEIYRNEIESVRKTETERLTAELTAELSAKLEEKKTQELIAAEAEIRRAISLENEKLKSQYMAEVREALTAEYEEKKKQEIISAEAEIRKNISLENEKLKTQYKAEVRNEMTAEYERKKQQEIASIEAEIRKNISLENEKLKTQYKTEVRNEMTAEYERKKQQEIASSEAEIRKNIALENEKLKTQYKTEVRNEMMAEYEEKKRQELAAAEKKLEETVSLQNEKLKTQYKAEVRNEMMAEYEEKKKQELAAAEKKLEETVSLQNEKLKTQYKAEVRNELTDEYEKKKNDEIKIIRKELGKEIAQQNKSTTERFHVVFFYLAVLTIAASVVSLVLIAIRMIREHKNCKERIEEYSKQYIGFLEEQGGVDSVLQESINKDSNLNENEKKLRRKGLLKAKANYDLMKTIPSLENCSKKLADLNPNSIFAKWNGAGDDTEFKMGLCDNFYKNIDEYAEIGSKLCFSRRYRPTESEKYQASDLLKTYSQTLENTSGRVKSLVVDGIDKALEQRLCDISRKYKRLAVKFNKERF